MDKIFEILKSAPVLTIIIMAILTVIALFLFKDIIKLYYIKKYNLYTRDDIESFARFSAKQLKRSQGLNVSLIKEWEDKKHKKNKNE